MKYRLFLLLSICLAFDAPAAVNKSTSTNVIPSLVTGKGLRLGCFGHSWCANGYNYSAQGAVGAWPLSYTYSRGIPQWASFFSHGLISLDYATGYFAQYATGVVKITVTAGGQGYSNPTISIPTCNGTFGPATVNGGAIQSIAVGTVTGTCSGSPAPVIITDSTGSGASAFATVSNGGSLGGPGETTTQILARLQDACTDTNDAELVAAGTNDVTNSMTAAATEANLKAIYEGLMGCGKFVVAMTEAPRSQTAVTSTQQLQLYAVDNWIRRYTREETAKNPSRFSNIALLDLTPEMTDASSATGEPYANCFYDGTHPAAGCAMIGGYKLFQILSYRFGLWGYSEGTGLTDLYDATNNPEGALATDPYMSATGGTVYSPCTGTVANGYTVGRGGSATTTCTASIEGPLTSTTRSDLFTGNRQVLTVSAGSGTNTEHYTFFSPSYSLATLGINAGDKLVAQVDVELSNTKKLNNLYMDIQCQNSGSTIVARAVAGYDVAGDYYPDTGTLGAFTTSMPFTLATAKNSFVVPATCTKLITDLLVGVDASGAAGSAGFTLKLANWTVRKLQ